jgi:hypothetical protein
MAESDRFSLREGLEPLDAEITVKDDAPPGLRFAVVEIAYESGLGPSLLRPIVCRVLRVRPDPNNWSDFANVDQELRIQLDNCAWGEVYDVIEEVHKCLTSPRLLMDELKKQNVRVSGRLTLRPDYFENEINKYFRWNGIGWQLVSGQVRVRGPESFERAVAVAVERLQATARQTASNELHQALDDLSKRPRPDITGAIQHAVAALECVVRDVCDDQRPILGVLITKYRHVVPAPIDQVIEKAWGYASEHGRHLREGQQPDQAEAELVVGIAATVVTKTVINN